jgi:hypothetical protein
MKDMTVVIIAVVSHKEDKAHITDDLRIMWVWQEDAIKKESETVL